ncbi:hypothetical protein C6Y45_05735 [Alkalicoccus saliphilus]|uniref:Uncharacterized protein n=1 Tax=Alkalicoccus saliphilus TaxID=200989 RepID=A0A2T4U830_9BACI|nr:hypothetical protein C6Y45_05735 [Alkalicoccus saliphilus]
MFLFPLFLLWLSANVPAAMTLSIPAEYSDTTNLSENLTDYFPYNTFVNHFEHKDLLLKLCCLRQKKKLFFTIKKSFFQSEKEYSPDAESAVFFL